MDWGNLAKQVVTLAPGIGTAMGGPVGAVVGLGVKALAGVFGINTDDADAKTQLESALQNITPEQALALKQADNAFLAQMKQLDVDVFKLEVDDRMNARAQHKGSWVPGVLSAIVVLGWVALMACLFAITLPDGSRDIILRALGTADSALTLCLAYWFGSSYGSQRKTELSAGGKS